MRQPLYIFLLAITTFTLSSCGDSSTGPDSDNEPNTYTFSVDINPSNTGSVSPSTEATYEEGEEIELQAVPNEEYVFSGWTGDIESTDNPLMVTIDQDYELTVNFELKTYELAIITEGEGSVQEEILEEPSKEYEHGTVVELTANPAEGHKFVEWTGDIADTQNPVQITVDSPKEVTAIFEAAAFYQDDNRITILCSDAEIGDTGTVDGVTYTKRSVEQITPSNAATTCTSGISDMEGLFMGEASFDEDISHWDVSSVEDMGYMFEGAAAFNQNISIWSVSNVKAMDGLFSGAESFNQDIGNWDVANVTDMRWMFEYTETFNQDLSSWDVSNVTQMRNMFFFAIAFDQDISGWCVSQIESEPDYFATDAAFEDDTSKHPVWGTCPQ